MTTLSVMTWNLENLFQPGGSSGPKTEADFTQKLETLATAISKLDPDVLAVQEVGQPAAFADLIQQLNGRYAHTQLSSQPDARGIRVGFLSKLPIEESEDIVAFSPSGLPSVPSIDRDGNLDESTRLSRGALRIRVTPQPGLAVHLLTAHLKSKLLSFPSRTGQARFTTRDETERARIAGIALLQRTAEAVTLRIKATEILERNPDAALILLGDLNDVTDAATTQILQGAPGSEIGTGGFNRPDRGDATRLFNLAGLIAEERRFSRVFKGNNELIDHIFASAALLPGQPRRLPMVDSQIDVIGAMPSIDDDPNERRGKAGSDHAPITARFEL
ncbi:MAG: endonuclease/exonuclease/phosphatase family protein [Pegethrix bostrychoides GSE-TBD4-15B]|uniref:Endonuclease/exonuclease/phosphatase family protein n=1 Tax=Pegethrix bostrychoides GSE-TBD4-15B TaxID=2839662 RepID=A0A951P900_9CYAN|nr:endonuclease/exonuclease/phosphatase family protein [Pegethrix bostrychoides GSE-TBD4-15B]